MLQVGLPGTVGTVEMQDLIFTNRAPTAGLVLVEWNVRASTAGSAGLWDCHVRIGGALGTELTPDECPALTSGVVPGCNAGSLMMHITPRASGYFENMWQWVSDHMIDDPDWNNANRAVAQNSVYVARGMLIESAIPSWFSAYTQDCIDEHTCQKVLMLLEDKISSRLSHSLRPTTINRGGGQPSPLVISGQFPLRHPVGPRSRTLMALVRRWKLFLTSCSRLRRLALAPMHRHRQLGVPGPRLRSGVSPGMRRGRGPGNRSYYFSRL
ncbi:hypothetical protein F4802DRAFT_545467 [Xylaria palmicola]|nr:hypothetical protein F4802DRAFT_545467 [Xylaria palmicola]